CLSLCHSRAPLASPYSPSPPFHCKLAPPPIHILLPYTTLFRSPANPSVSAFIAAFKNLNAVGECCIISSHHFTVSSSISAKGTTVFTKPMSKASCALY